jgi:hypothetical protein
MKIRLTLLAIVALATLAWVAIDRGLVAGARSAQPAQRLSAQPDPETSAPQPGAGRAPVPAAISDLPASSTAVPAATAIAAVAAADEQPSRASDPSERPGSRLAALERGARAGERKAARDWVEAIEKCAMAMYGQQMVPQPTHLSHLSWNLFEPQHALRIELLGGLVEECGTLFPPADRERAMQQARDLIAQAIRLWAASGDPLGRLAQSQIETGWPPPPDQWRQQQAWAAAHLNVADPQTLIDLAYHSDASRFTSEAAWRLAACDLGYDCAAGGALARRICLGELQCFAGSYEEELLLSLPPRQWQIAQAQRRALVEMLRRGETATIFDVPPPGP